MTRATHRKTAARFGFHRVLVPTDLTPRTKRSFDMACGLVAPGGTVILLHVIEQIQGLPVAELAGFYRKLERRSNAAMRRLVRGAPPALNVVAHVRIGSRPEEIVRAAAATRASLIVLASHRVRPGRARDWGTISYQVSVLARCPVLLIK